MSASPSPPPAIPSGTTSPPPGERRPSFSFLRKSTKSGDAVKAPAVLQKKQKPQSGSQSYQDRQPTIPNIAPRIASFNPSDPVNAAAVSSDRQRSAPTPIASEFAGYHAMPYPPSSPPQPGQPAQPFMASSSSPAVQPSEQDPYAKTESMAHRGRYSYASTTFGPTGVNSPRRVRRRKDPTPFNILVVGAKNSGKSSFIDFLQYALRLKPKSHTTAEKTPSPPATAVREDSPFIPHYLETEVDHERIGVTLWDSQGLEKTFVDLQLKEMSAFIESKFEETFKEEQKVNRSPGVRDSHIHCVFLVLDPSRLDSNSKSTQDQGRSSGRIGEPPHLRGILDQDLDIQVLQTLKGKTTVIPVISKADTVTTAHMVMLKKQVWASIKEAKLDPLETLNLTEEVEDDIDDEADVYHNSSSDLPNEDSELIDNLIDRSSDDDAATYHRNGGYVQHTDTPPTSNTRSSNGHVSTSRAHRLSAAIINSPQDLPAIPMSIISPDSYEGGVIGRRFPWGFADPYNPEHCDFVRLKESVFSDWRGELREASREMWYEGWRTLRLKRRGKSIGGHSAGSAAFMNNGTSPSYGNSVSNYAGGNKGRYNDGPKSASTRLGPQHPNNLLRATSSPSPAPTAATVPVPGVTKQFDTRPPDARPSGIGVNDRSRSHGAVDNNAAGFQALNFEDAVPYHPSQEQIYHQNQAPTIPSASKPSSSQIYSNQVQQQHVLPDHVISNGSVHTNNSANNNTSFDAPVYGSPVAPVRLPPAGSPEMIAGRYQSGVNAF